MVKFLVLLSFIVGMATTAEAQAIRGAKSAPMRSFLNKTTERSTANHPLVSPLGVEQSLSYYQSNTQGYSWTLPVNYGVVVFGLTERFELPAAGGYLDSVRIGFDGLSGNSVAVYIDPDSLIETSVGLFHLDPVLFANDPHIYQSAIQIESLNGSDTAIVALPHIPVPKNFHVFITPFDLEQGAYTASCAITGDREATRARTIDNAHSTYVATDGQSIYSGVIDSNITPNGEAPLYSNLNVTAYFSAGGSSVDDATVQPGSTYLFPSPASSDLVFRFSDRECDLDLIDALGRSQIEKHVRSGERISIESLPSGRYIARLHFGQTVLTQNILIAH
jgi:hypothetical protein